MPVSGELPGGKSGRGSENKVSFIAAVQTTETGGPLKVCLKKLDFTKEAIAEWAKTALAASAHVVSDGLWCFKAVTASGATQERIVKISREDVLNHAWRLVKANQGECGHRS